VMSVDGVDGRGADWVDAQAIQDDFQVGEAPLWVGKPSGTPTSREAPSEAL
jgi:hypothetical protein